MPKSPSPNPCAQAMVVILAKAGILAGSYHIPVSVTIRPHNDEPNWWVAEIGRYSGVGGTIEQAFRELANDISENE
jgi:hypothetical protein